MAAPLVATDRPSHDRDRAAALVRLQAYPTELILSALLEALEDPSLQVRREALRVCYLRRIDACLEPATEQYQVGSAPTLRAAALRVLAQDPAGARLDLLLEALRDPSDTLRAEAAQLAGWASVTGEARVRTRRALLAKLSDGASSVRQRAVTAVGLQGPGDGTLAVTRLLEDPEPTVRAAAATALGRLRDRRATGALLRAIDGQNEGNVVRAMIEGLARLPGDGAATALLGYLDEPPPGVGMLTVAEAIGDRRNPEPALIEGLVERLREPQLREACVSALLWLGHAATPTLKRAQDRGLDPALEREVARLLAATRPSPAAAASTRWPAADARGAWAALLRRGSVADQLTAGAALAERAPPWLPGTVQARLARAPSIDAVRGWVVALASLERRAEFRSGNLSAWGLLARWAHDDRASTSDRCLAVLALGNAAGRRAESLAHDALRETAGDASPRVRACSALATGRLQQTETTAVLLLDTDPRVRTAAAVGLRASGELPDALALRLRQLATADPDPHVRQAARAPEPPSSALTFVVEAPAETPWVRPSRWLPISAEPGALVLPALGSAGAVWTAAPGITPRIPEIR